MSCSARSFPSPPCQAGPAPDPAWEGGPAPDRDPGAAAGGPFPSRQGPARLPGRRPSPDLSRERERRFRVSVRIPHAVPPSHSVRPAAPPRRTRRTLQMAALMPPRRTRRTMQMAASTPPPACPVSGTLFRAYRARARAPVSAGAVRAPDCARTREPRRRAHVSCPFRWNFFAPARSSPADAASTAPY